MILKIVILLIIVQIGYLVSKSNKVSWVQNRRLKTDLHVCNMNRDASNDEVKSLRKMNLDLVRKQKKLEKQIVFLKQMNGNNTRK